MKTNALKSKGGNVTLKRILRMIRHHELQASLWKMKLKKRTEKLAETIAEAQ